MVMNVTSGADWLLRNAPPLRRPPLSLLDLAVPLIDVDQAVGAQQEAIEKAASAQAAVTEAEKRYADAPEETRAAAALAAEQARDALADSAGKMADLADRVADLQRWEHGFQYLPELGNTDALELIVPDASNSTTTGAVKRTDATQTATAWYDPFEVVAHDDRSLFGVPFEERSQRALRALLAHEPWQVEHEFWTGAKIPTNYHLTASPKSPTTSPHRTIDAWGNPTAAPTTTLGTAVGLKQSLAALDQAIANSDAGVGMIHATPYLVQLWASTYPYLRDSAGRILTVNMNIVVPGYGYTGSGPDNARTVADGATNSNTNVTSATAAFTAQDVGAAISGTGIPAGTTIASVTNATTVVISAAATATATGVTLTITPSIDRTTSTLQWAYATDSVYRCSGASHLIPWDFRQGAPEVNVNNSMEVRAERSYGLITNRLLRAAVLVDTTQA